MSSRQGEYEFGRGVIGVTTVSGQFHSKAQQQGTEFIEQPVDRYQATAFRKSVVGLLNS